MDQAPLPSAPRRIALLPLLLFVALFAYFALRYWRTGERIHLLLATINVVGVFLVLAAWRRR